MSTSTNKGLTQIQGLIEQAEVLYQKLLDTYNGNIPDNILKEFNKGKQYLLNKHQAKLEADEQFKQVSRKQQLKELKEIKKGLNSQLHYFLKLNKKRIGRLAETDNTWWINEHSDPRNVSEWWQLGTIKDMLVYILEKEKRNYIKFYLKHVSEYGFEYEGISDDELEINLSLDILRKQYNPNFNQHLQEKQK